LVNAKATVVGFPFKRLRIHSTILAFRRFDTASLTLGSERLVVTCCHSSTVLGHDFGFTAPADLRRRAPSTR
jgi:hypothetical protein